MTRTSRREEALHYRAAPAPSRGHGEARRVRRPVQLHQSPHAGTVHDKTLLRHGVQLLPGADREVLKQGDSGNSNVLKQLITAPSGWTRQGGWGKLSCRNPCPLYVKGSLANSSSFDNREFADDGQIGTGHDAHENLCGF
jgi:hypothetical protein